MEVHLFLESSFGTYVLISLSFFIPKTFTGTYVGQGIKVDGKTPRLLSTRWKAYEATKRSEPLHVQNGGLLEVTTKLRMVWRKAGLLWSISIKNVGSVPSQHQVDFILSGLSRQVFQTEQK